jgi:hypothetical protein
MLAGALTLALACATSADAQTAVRKMSWANTNPPVVDLSPNCSALPSESALYVSFVAPSGISSWGKVKDAFR